MKTIFIFHLVLVFFILPIYSQETDSLSPDYVESNILEKEQYVHVYNNSFGVRYSSISGYGLSLSRQFFEHYKLIVSCLVHYNEYMRWEDISKNVVEEDSKDILYDFGIEFQRDIYTSNSTRIFALIGGYYSSEKSNNFHKGQGQDNEIFHNQLNAGVGFGLQFYINKYVAGDISCGYKFYLKDSQENGKPSTEKKTTIGLGVGLSFFF
ncbi:hypothetical protein ACFLSQ_00215 [Bacteroidota bacterium]